MAKIVRAACIPDIARQYGAYVVEINPGDSAFTRQITHLHLKGKAVRTMTLIA